MTKQAVVARRIEFQRVEKPRLYSRRVGIDDVLQQAHDRFAVGDGMEINKSEGKRIALRCDKEPERIERFALREGGVQLLLNFSRERQARTFLPQRWSSSHRAPRRHDSERSLARGSMPGW